MILPLEHSRPIPHTGKGRKGSSHFLFGEGNIKKNNNKNKNKTKNRCFKIFKV